MSLVRERVDGRDRLGVNVLSQQLGLLSSSLESLLKRQGFLQHNCNQNIDEQFMYCISLLVHCKLSGKYCENHIA